MKNYKKILILLATICLSIAIISFLLIYAKYTTSANSQTDVPIARWNILVNNISIKNNTDISNTLTPVFPGNENIASNIIAPTAEGYFDLNFDFSDEILTITDLDLKETDGPGISILSGPVKLILNGSNTIVGGPEYAGIYVAIGATLVITAADAEVPSK